MEWRVSRQRCRSSRPDALRCWCGCSTAILPSRVFVNRAHQVTWLRAEGAKRRVRNLEDACSLLLAQGTTETDLLRNPLRAGAAGDRRADGDPGVQLAWLLRRSPVVLPIPGTLSIEHLRENRLGEIGAIKGPRRRARCCRRGR